MTLPRTGWQLADGSVLDFMEISDGYLAKRVGTTIVGATFSGGPSAATTVSSATTFGVTAATGTGSRFAREDHRHGSPPAGVAVTDASGGAVIDVEARTAINALLASLRATGAIAT